HPGMPVAHWRKDIVSQSRKNAKKRIGFFWRLEDTREASYGAKSRKRAGSRFGAFTAEQAPVKRSTRKQHFFNCRIHGSLCQSSASRELDLELGTPAHQFFDECRTDAFRAADDPVPELIGDLQAASIKLGQPGAALVIREREFNRLIDASGARN